jgi:hypothetical protein
MSAPTARIRRYRVIAALAVAILPVAAQAGDSTGTTFFRGLAVIWNGPNTNGFLAAEDVFVDEYSNNFSNNLAPAVVQVSRSLTRNGSTLIGRAQGVSSGFYASRNFAEIDVRNVVAGNQYSAIGGTGSKTALRVEDPFEAARRATFRWTVTGTSTVPPGVLGDATSRLDFGYSTDPFSDWFDLFRNPQNLNAQTFFGPGTYEVTVPLVPGQPLYIHYWSSAFTQIDPGEAPLGGNFRLTADFASTFVLDAIDLFDENEEPLLYDWSVVDEDSGELLFDNNGRVAFILDALPPPQVVPVPAPAVLLLSALGMLAARRRLSAKNG